MSCLEVVVRTDGVPAGLRALPADSMGHQETQPEVLLLQRNHGQVRSASVWAPCWHPGAGQGSEHPWVLWEQKPLVPFWGWGHIHGTAVVWMPPLPPHVSPWLWMSWERPLWGSQDPKGWRTQHHVGLGWVLGTRGPPSSALPSQVAQRRGPFPERPV